MAMFVLFVGVLHGASRFRRGRLTDGESMLQMKSSKKMRDYFELEKKCDGTRLTRLNDLSVRFAFNQRLNFNDIFSIYLR